ncbi:MAG: allantoate amidohydrolase [Telmatospirillum sp.]|nr:allantoate amidohydrolase [Telmatospirillum sp.]
MTEFSRSVLARCDALAALTETPGMITRTYLTDQHAAANRLVGGWMAEAGMTVAVDGAGSVTGRIEGTGADPQTVIIGSHLDSVRNAGRYDGILGVVLGISVVDAIVRSGRRLPFAIEVVGFGEEEGVRFGTSLIGSRALAGTFRPEWLRLKDEAGISLSKALREFGLDPAAVAGTARSPGSVKAYLEAHIEQGPVLESLSLPVGVVSAICGATRRRFRVAGTAGHAGTVPMDQRRAALAGAAEMGLAIERIAGTAGIVGTVGRLSVHPDAVNVIPGDVVFTLDLRAERDHDRITALADIDDALDAIANRRRLAVERETFHESPSVPCDPALRRVLEDAITAGGVAPHTLPSGAGHDAMAIAPLAPVAMLFIRCAGGISHNPAEQVMAADIDVAGTILADTVFRLADIPR